MVDMLNAMQQLMTGDPEYFDTAFLDELGQCWDDTHPDLRQAEDQGGNSRALKKARKMA